ncbi:hypothetical protein B0J14DRAFT_695558 [Halenospora varia]|nr:hypothetical protein B0J14DRAFT_695558 [Halenospora varia]
MGQYEKVLKITSFRYKKDDSTDEEFHDFCTDHGNKASLIQQRHGALKVAQVWVRTTNDMAAIFTDPDFQALVVGDIPESQDKAHVTCGWEEVFLEDGKIVDVPNIPFNERSAVGKESTIFGLEKIPAGTKV